MGEGQNSDKSVRWASRGPEQACLAVIKARIPLELSEAVTLLLEHILLNSYSLHDVPVHNFNSCIILHYVHRHNYLINSFFALQ